MPARTNEFQRLVARIYQARQEDGSVVVESGFVRENGVSGEAEIDVLITKKTSGTTIRIGVECRSHTRPQGVEWLRELAQKRESTDLHHVIAVSRSGFTKGALEKARQERIECLTLKEAEEADWSETMPRLGALACAWNVRLLSAEWMLEADGEVPGFAEATVVECEGGRVIGKVMDLPPVILMANRSLIDRAFDDRARQTCKTRADLENPIALEFPLTPKAPQEVCGHRVLAVVLRLEARATLQVIEVTHYAIGDARVTSASMDLGGKLITMSAAQWKDIPNTVTVHVDSVAGGAIDVGDPSQIDLQG